MNYNTTKIQNLLLWPTIYPTEHHLLHHLFFVNGNGYYWQDGELVSRDIDGDSPRRELSTKELMAEYHARRAKRQAHWAAVYDDMYPEEHIKKMRALNMEVPKRRDFIKEACTPTNTPIKLYPLSDYSLISRIPGNVKPDWLKAAKQAIALARTWEHTPLDLHWLKKFEERLEEIEREQA